MVEGGYPDFNSHPVSWRGIGAARASGRRGHLRRHGVTPSAQQGAEILQRMTEE
jgi:hypothetical protein